MRLRLFTFLSLGLYLVALPAMAAPAPKQKLPIVAPKPVAPDVTGLVIDARDLDYEPCMSPRLYDESAHNLLEGLSFAPEKVTNDGFARWVRAYNPDEPNPRTGSKPLILKPTRIEGGDRLIFSTEDAARLKTANAKDKFLDRMRVLIVY